jgi:uncharacterized protein YjbJ (UPF0337 family)
MYQAKSNGRSANLTGNENQQAKGAAKQVEGNVRKAVGNVEEAPDKADEQTR